ncbi:MAG: hypothetical protein QXI91_05340 [Candidatus Bathyarchaeia archaeon]
MELSPEEKRRIEKLSLIPAAIVVYIALGLFIYLNRNVKNISVYFCLAYFGAVLFGMSAVLFFTEVMLTSRKTGKPLKAYSKVFFGRMLLCAFGGGLLLCILGVAYFAFSFMLSESQIVILGGAVWFIVWSIIAFRYKDKIGEIYEGCW